MSKTIFIFNDGTGQALSSENPTNVAKLFWAQPGISEYRRLADGFKIDKQSGNVSIYVRGVGTADSYEVQNRVPETLFEKAKAWIADQIKTYSEQGFGTTIVDRVQRSYDLFNSVYEKDDEIVLVGFSRGAASVRLLASELIKRKEVKIKYMLIFDTVYSVTGQIKILDNPPIQRFTDFDLSPNILRCDHLVAGDEMRSAFPFSPVNKRGGVRQILFAGSHSDVGGGHAKTGLSDICLKFALEQFEAMGFKADNTVVMNLKPNHEEEITFVLLAGSGQRHYPRKLNEADFIVHRSVIERSKAKGRAAFALAQLSTFTTNSNDELINPTDIDSSFDL